MPGNIEMIPLPEGRGLLTQDKKQFNLVAEISGDETFKTYYGLEIYDGSKWHRFMRNFNIYA